MLSQNVKAVSMLTLITLTTLASVDANARTAERQCASLVQGRIAWDYEGSKTWDPANVRKLCRGASVASQPARCFQIVMHGGVDSGRGTKWRWEDALNLCAGSDDAAVSIRCFQRDIRRGIDLQRAVDHCQAETVVRQDHRRPAPDVTVVRRDYRRPAPDVTVVRRVYRRPAPDVTVVRRDHRRPSQDAAVVRRDHRRPAPDDSCDYPGACPDLRQ